MNDLEVLKSALKLGIIDIAVMRDKLEKESRMKYLSMHTYSVWQGSNGFWYTRFKNDDGTKKLVKRLTKEAIEDAIVDYYKKLTFVPTFKEVFKLWLEYKITYKEICEGTFDRYTTEFERFFKDTDLYLMDVSKITDDILDDFIRERIITLNLTAKSYGNMRTLIIGTMKYAKKQGYTDLSISNFFGDLQLSRRMFKKTKKDSKDEVFNEEETLKLTEYLKENATVENLGILLTFQCGIREGELSALKFSDITGNKLHIQRQEVKYKDKENKGKVVHKIVEYTKSDNGDRYIMLPNNALDTIAKIKELNPNNEFMMVNRGKKINTNTFNDRLYTACIKCNIPKRSMHKIRKTYGTMLIDSGADDSLVMSQLGHADIETSRKYYYYSNKNDDSKLAQIEKAILI